MKTKRICIWINQKSSKKKPAIRQLALMDRPRFDADQSTIQTEIKQLITIN